MNSRTETQTELPEKIIYVMGPGRCGTTLLDVVLSNCDDAEGYGELAHIFRDGFIADQACSCGQQTGNCKVWSRLPALSGWTDVEFSRLSEMFAYFSSHQNFPLIYLGLAGKDRRRDYASANDILFSSLRQIGKKNVIVDSSKYAGRAMELAATYQDRVFIVSITRDPLGVLCSFSKAGLEQERKSTLAALIYYCYVLLCMRMVCWRRRKQVISIAYEDLCAAPSTTIRRIGEFCGINTERVISLLSENGLFDVGHIVTGNRLRHQRQVKFEHTHDQNKTSPGMRSAALLMRGWRWLLRV